MQYKTINHLIATEIFKYKVSDQENCLYIRPADNQEFFLPHYSTEIAEAWKIIELFDTWPLTIIKSGDYYKVTLGYKGKNYIKEGEPLPLLICQVALEVRGIII